MDARKKQYTFTRLRLPALKVGAVKVESNVTLHEVGSSSPIHHPMSFHKVAVVNGLTAQRILSVMAAEKTSLCLGLPTVKK